MIEVWCYKAAAIGFVVADLFWIALGSFAAWAIFNSDGTNYKYIEAQ